MGRVGARKIPEWSLPERREQRRDRGREHADDDHEGAGRADMIHQSGDGLAEVHWHGDASTLGLLSAAVGMGVFGAALFLASRRSVLELAKWIALAPVFFGLAMVGFSFARSMWAAALLLTASGFALLLMTAAANTVLQSIVDEDKRGRIVSLYTTMVTGLAPVGGLLAGLLAEHVGAPIALRLAGLTCLAASAPVAVRFQRKQTIPPVATGAPLLTPAFVMAPDR